jgi:DNA invertase Pin-like site-specific DNA recombinase
MRKVFCYMRVSTEGQAEHGYSLESQDAVLKDYASGHQLEVVGTFVESESAFTSGKRPEFARMCSGIRKSDVRAVLCYRLDRLTRNLTDFAMLTEDLNVALISMTEGEVSDDSNQLMGGIHAVFARNYSTRLSQVVTLGMATKAAKGLWPTSAPAGYVNVDRDGEKIIEPDPVNAPLVARLFERYAHGGVSLTELGRWAARSGLRTNRKCRISRSTIHSILSNQLYYGVVEWKGTITQGKHEPLVSRELWDECQDRLHGNAHPREQRHHFPYRGLLTCGRCGCQLTASLIKGRYVYYHCTRKRGACSQPFIRAEEIGGLLAPAVDALRVPADVYERLVSDYEAQAIDRERGRKARLIQAKAALRRASELRTKLYREKLEGVIDDARWGEIDREYAAEEEDARAEVERMTKSAESGADRAAAVFKLLDVLPDRYREESDDQRAVVLGAIGSNYVLDGYNVQAVYRSPFDKVAEGVRTGDWRSVIDEVQTASVALIGELIVS